MSDQFTQTFTGFFRSQLLRRHPAAVRLRLYGIGRSITPERIKRAIDRDAKRGIYAPIQIHRLREVLAQMEAAYAAAPKLIDTREPSEWERLLHDNSGGRIRLTHCTNDEA